MTEKWLPVVNYEGLYEVSNMGNVRKVNGKEVKQFVDPNRGYMKLALRKEKKIKFSLFIDWLQWHLYQTQIITRLLIIRMKAEQTTVLIIWSGAHTNTIIIMVVSRKNKALPLLTVGKVGR